MASKHGAGNAHRRERDSWMSLPVPLGHVGPIPRGGSSPSSFPILRRRDPDATAPWHPLCVSPFGGGHAGDPPHQRPYARARGRPDPRLCVRFKMSHVPDVDWIDLFKAHAATSVNARTSG